MVVLTTESTSTTVLSTVPTYSLAQHKEFSEKIDNGLTNLQELKENLEKCIAAEKHIKDELRNFKVDELKEKLTIYSHSTKKEEIINDVYTGMLMRFCVGHSCVTTGVYVYGSKGLEEERSLFTSIRETVDKVTEADLEKKAKDVAEYNRFSEKAFSNPESKQEFIFFIRHFGTDALTQKQKVRWDELRADSTLAKKEEELAQKAVVTKVALDNVELKLVEHFHTNRNHNVYIVTMSEKVSRGVYDELCRKARQLGGNYSKPWRDRATGSLCPGGFMFNDKEDAEKFMQLKEGDVSRLDDLKAHKEEVKENAIEHLQEVAQSLVEKARESQSVDRLANTERRARFAANAERESEHNLFLAKTLENIAQAISNGETKYLSNIRAKTHVETLEALFRATKWEKAKKEDKRYEDIKDEDPIADDVQYIEYPYPSLNFRHLREAASIKQAKGITLIVKRLTKLFTEKDKEKGYVAIKTVGLFEDLKTLVGRIRPFDKVLAEYMIDRYAQYERLQVMGLTNLPTLRTALREYLSYRGNQTKANPIKELERKLIGTKIPGYFPTPIDVVEKMLELVDIQENQSILEPNGGKGNIADVIRQRHPLAKLSVIEINSQLREILMAKGHDLVAWNFLEHQETYDFIIMNPPFEAHQDCHHIKHAHSLLNPGGKVVAIMGEGAFFRMDKESVSFRNWLESLGGTNEKLPNGSFLDSERSTGVAARIVVINKSDDITNLHNVDVVDTSIEANTSDNLPETLSDEVKDNFLEPEINPLSEDEVNQINQADDVNKVIEDEVNEVEKRFDGILSVEEYKAIKDDFLQHQRNYSVMCINPPEHSWQDIEHIYHAYDLLNIGGCLTSTISERSLAKCSSTASKVFSKWLKTVGGTSHELPDGSYVIMITKNTFF